MGFEWGWLYFQGERGILQPHTSPDPSLKLLEFVLLRNPTFYQNWLHCACKKL